MELWQIISLVGVGVLAGFLGGLLGIGGSSVMLPAMVLILGVTVDGVEQINQYMAAAMIVNFLLICPAVLAHARNRAVWKKVWVWMAPAGMAGVVVGVQISYLFNRTHLRWAVGAFFVYVVVHNIHRLIWGQTTEGRTREQVEAGPVWPRLAIGFPMGISAGLLGIGGGSLAVPALQMGLKVPIRNAVATSSATIMAFSWIGAIVKNVQLGEDGTVTRSLILAACFAPTAMIGSYFGGHMTHKLPVKVVRIVFIALMAYASLRMLGIA